MAKPLTPDGGSEVQHDERLVRGIVLDNRAQFVLAEIDDILDRAAVEIFKRMQAEKVKGPIGGHAAVCAWYERLAIEELRNKLHKEVRNTTRIGRR